ncbi:nitroreductase family protein [Dehalobacterium formicoaceticum]|uniref:Nitroreductase family protein n=1 Tax=Dehalobacterium formicoaceticum TaxID=51515 RepID=A0ABT1Y0J9_9FIRM|nr:nitroreductase family protein [Dehalobacterium formicoaceticum]MCR6544394.1 nitroreductase family protein [Dehalobacterium formicoaceticum]
MDVFEAIEKRKSVRAYTPEQISPEALTKIVDAGQCPPNAGPYQISVLQNSEFIKKLNDLTADAMRNSGNEFFISRISLPGYEPLYGAPTVILLSEPAGSPFSGVNTALAAENMLLAATGLDLASCYLFTPTLAFAGDQTGALAKEAGIQEGYAVTCAVIVGYSGGEAFTSPNREKKGVVNYVK